MSRKLVAYFSASGVTAKAAKELAQAADADLYEIKPAVPYTKEDLNWMDVGSRSTREMKGGLPYPALADHGAPIESHDVIFLGFPIWWYVAPTIINAFLESYNFSGKKIVLFATSGGSGFGRTVQALQKDLPAGAELIEGCMMNRALNREELSRWAEQYER